MTARTYTRRGWIISRNGPGMAGAALRWRLWHESYGSAAADTLAGAYQLARDIERTGRA